MVKVSCKNNGKFKKVSKYLAKMQKPIDKHFLDKYGELGVEALKNATPVDSGATRDSWFYRIEEKNGIIKIKFCNSNNADKIPVAILLQYGHLTGTGGWVEGINYINPAIRPVFNRIKDDAVREVSNR